MKKGLSSGEGVVWSLRDRPGKDDKASDHRLLVRQPRFSRVLSGLGNYRRFRRCCVKRGTGEDLGKR